MSLREPSADSGTGRMRGLTSFLNTSPIRLRSSASRTTTKSQPWLLPGLEALVAAFSTLRISSSGTGSGFSQRIARQVSIASSASIAASFSNGLRERVQLRGIRDQDRVDLLLGRAAVAQ